VKIQARQRGKSTRARARAPPPQGDMGLSITGVHAGSSAAAFTQEGEYGEDHAAAVVRLQAMQRGRQVRGRPRGPANVVYAPDTPEYGEEQARAAVKIQAIQRGRRTRAQRGSAGAAQAPDEPQYEYGDDHARAAVRIQAQARGRATRRARAGGARGARGAAPAEEFDYGEDHARAAVRIQAQARGRATRRGGAAARRPQEQPAGAAPPAGADAELDAAARKIQALQRGRQASAPRCRLLISGGRERRRPFLASPDAP
jgi:hypothetical protein